MTRVVQKQINVKLGHMLYTQYIQHGILKQNLRKINFFYKYYKLINIKINLVTKIITVEWKIKNV